VGVAVGLWTETGTGSNWKERVEVKLEPTRHQFNTWAGLSMCTLCGMSWRQSRSGYEEIIPGGVKVWSELPGCSKHRRAKYRRSLG